MFLILASEADFQIEAIASETFILYLIKVPSLIMYWEFSSPRWDDFFSTIKLYNPNHRIHFPTTQIAHPNT